MLITPVTRVVADHHMLGSVLPAGQVSADQRHYRLELTLTIEDQ